MAEDKTVGCAVYSAKVCAIPFSSGYSVSESVKTAQRTELSSADGK